MKSKFNLFCVSMFGVLALSSCGAEPGADSTKTPNNQNIVSSSSIWCQAISIARTTCALTSGSISSASLSHTYAGSCLIGADWGYDQNSVWVQNGCDAAFYISGTDMVVPPQYNPANHGSNQGTQTNIFRCESSGGATQPCPFTLGQIVTVTINRQLSYAPCGALPGLNWNVNLTTNILTVMNGCRADFNVVYRPH